MKACTIAGCEKKQFASKLCSKHWERVRKYGSPHITLRVIDTDIDRHATARAILARGSVQVGDCIEYTTCRDDKGYGKVMIDRKRAGAHRVSYEVNNGRIPDGQMVRHTCDNPPCINPAHLVLGTNDQNMADMVERGRSLVGQKQPNAKLTDDQALEIIARLREGEMQSALAREFGVSHTTIYSIAANKGWKHLPRDGRAAA